MSQLEEQLQKSNNITAENSDEIKDIRGTLSKAQKFNYIERAVLDVPRVEADYLSGLTGRGVFNRISGSDFVKLQQMRDFLRTDLKKGIYFYFTLQAFFNFFFFNPYPIIGNEKFINSRMKKKN